MPVLRLTDESIMKSFQISNKKHIILTGSRGIGKSTLVERLVPHLPSDTRIIKTSAIPREKVTLTDCHSLNQGIIGLFSNGSMKMFADGFLNVGLTAIESAIASDCSWVIIDELGFLESDCPAFTQAVLKLFECKHVLAVLRKQSTGFLDSIRFRDDVFVCDLDEPVRPVGCVIMASGEGKRFGSNKLMADFNGKPLISNILEITEGGLFSDRVVVTRHLDVHNICKENHIPVILHDFPDRNDTVRLGLTSLLKNNPHMTGCMFAVSDQPLLTRESLEHMILTYSHLNPCDSIVQLGYNGITGNPVIFGSSYFHELLQLPHKKGGGAVIKQHPHQVTVVAAKSNYELSDIDTTDDYYKFTNS